MKTKTFDYPVTTGLFVIDRNNSTDNPLYSSIEYVGEIFKGTEEDSIKVKRIKGDEESLVLRLMFMARLHNYTRTSHITTGNVVTEVTYSTTVEPEIEVDEDVYGKIATVYKKLIKMGIVVESCKFVKNGPYKVHMQMPTGLTIYTPDDKEDIASHVYYENDFIKNSIPAGMNYEKLVKLIWM